jgi:hypothetical protein
MAVPPINNPTITHNGNEPENNPAYYDEAGADEYDIVDEIAESEEEFLDMDKHHNKYYIGSAIYYPEYNSIQLDTSISPATLFSYEIDDIALYLAEYSICNIMRTLPCVHIMQLDIKPDGEYCAIIKTFWIRIVQRAWKKRFANRKNIMRSRGNIAAQRHFELTGTYPKELRVIPGLHGLLRRDPEVKL